MFSLEVSGDKVVAGTEKKGIFISSDNGNNWKEANNGLTHNRTVWTLMDDNGSLYAGLNFGLFVTHDYGTKWGSLGLPMIDIGSLIKTGSHIIAGGYTVLISKDNGLSWDVKNNGLPKDDITDLAMSDSILFALTTNWGLYKSNDFGESWKKNIVFKINSNNKIFVYDSLIFIGTSFSGVYFSHNLGKTWKNISDELAYKSIYSFEIKDGYLYAGTARDGVWKRKLSEFVGIEDDVASQGLTVWPNPVHEKLHIRMPYFAKAELQIIDLNGNVMYHKNHYSKDIELNVDGFSRGIYLLKIVSENHCCPK